MGEHLGAPIVVPVESEIVLYCDDHGRWKVARKLNDGSALGVRGYARSIQKKFAPSPNLVQGGERVERNQHE